MMLDFEELVTLYKDLKEKEERAFTRGIYKILGV